jgi:hypothetical protein
VAVLVFAHTSTIYLDMPGRPAIAEKSAEILLEQLGYLERWAKEKANYPTADARAQALDYVAQATKVYEDAKAGEVARSPLHLHNHETASVRKADDHLCRCLPGGANEYYHLVVNSRPVAARGTYRPPRCHLRPRLSSLLSCSRHNARR